MGEGTGWGMLALLGDPHQGVQDAAISEPKSLPHGFDCKKDEMDCAIGPPGLVQRAHPWEDRYRVKRRWLGSPHV